MLHGSLNDWLTREWLLANGRGGFASSTLVGCPTRRYHGWLFWNRPGIVNRWLLWSHAAEHIVVGTRTFLLSNFEFNSAIDPHGYQHLRAFACHADGPRPAVVWDYEFGGVALRKTLWLDRGADRVSVRYELHGRDDVPLRMQLWPLIACREAQSLRRKSAGQFFDVTQRAAGFTLINRLDRDVGFALGAHAGGHQASIEFQMRPDWWYNFKYRQEAALGHECGEDLFVPGSFVAQAAGGLIVTLIADAAARDPAPLAADCRTIETPAAPEQASAAPPAETLHTALRQCVIAQPDHGDASYTLLLAGYPWLDSYSRDACVAVPGLLLNPADRPAAARVLARLASLLRDGLLPNHVIDDAADHEYAAADEPLWFIHAADALLRAEGDRAADTDKLIAACTAILDAYIAGTRRTLADGRQCVIAMDPADGLISCGGPNMACTWMDARCAGRWVTPRHGKPVEVNALWFHALRSVAGRIAGRDAAAAQRYQALADRVRQSFEARFWSESHGYLADVINEGGADFSLRPNQLLAVALPHCPIDEARCRRVFEVVKSKLLTPFGLRTLSPDDPAYRGCADGDPDAREAAAHQGGVYPWLIGAFVDAALRVEGRGPAVRAQWREYFAPLIDHLRQDVGLGGVSGWFDGDAPHAPRGCPFQAWSAAEVLRAIALLADPAAIPAESTETAVAAPNPKAAPSETAASRGVAARAPKVRP